MDCPGSFSMIKQPPCIDETSVFYHEPVEKTTRKLREKRTPPKKESAGNPVISAAFSALRSVAEQQPVQEALAARTPPPQIRHTQIIGKGADIQGIEAVQPDMRFQIPITGRGKDSDIKANQVQEGQQNALFQAEQGLINCLLRD